MEIAAPAIKSVIEKIHHKEFELRFMGEIIGFPQSVSYKLCSDSRIYPFFKLISLDEPGLEFTVTDPWTVKEDYSIEIPDTYLESLELNDSRDLMVLAIVTLIPGKSSMSLNLAAPVIINSRSGRGFQIILEDSSLPIRYSVKFGE
ncbi:MAG: flagellar assembly protein FliW [Candidatus Eremiobacteraeota bacterium]|nr:flagellar assembly protein FliW [Candidatus Eremiobacteraeota bacterium]